MFHFNTQDTAKQQAAQFGPQWQAEVTSKDGKSWKDLNGWKSVYEPPAPPQQQSAAASYMANKAKQVLAQKIATSVTAKILTLSLETTSQVLTKAQEQAIDAAATCSGDVQQSLAKNTATTQAWDTLACLLNNFNAIVLTFRFEKDDATKCQYLRRIASDKVADILYQAFQTAENAGKYLDDVREKVTFQIESQKDIVKDFVETSLDAALQEAVQQANASAEEKLHAAKKQLSNATEQADKKLKTLVGSDTSTATPDPATQQEIQKLEQNIQQSQMDIQDETITLLSDCIKLIVLKKMDRLVVLLVYLVDRLFDGVEELYNFATDLALTQQQLRDHVFQVISTSFQEYQKTVALEVKRGVTVLQAIMEEGGDDGDGASS